MTELPLLLQNDRFFTLSTDTEIGCFGAFILPSGTKLTVGLTQLDVLLWGHFKTQTTQIRPTARLWELLQMRHTSLWTSETHETGQKPDL